jgi:hypothetical protein
MGKPPRSVWRGSTYLASIHSNQGQQQQLARAEAAEAPARVRGRVSSIGGVGISVSSETEKWSKLQTAQSALTPSPQTLR